MQKNLIITFWSDANPWLVTLIAWEAVAGSYSKYALHNQSLDGTMFNQPRDDAYKRWQLNRTCLSNQLY